MTITIDNDGAREVLEVHGFTRSASVLAQDVRMMLLEDLGVMPCDGCGALWHGDQLVPAGILDEQPIEQHRFLCPRCAGPTE